MMMIVDDLLGALLDVDRGMPIVIEISAGRLLQTDNIDYARVEDGVFVISGTE